MEDERWELVSSQQDGPVFISTFRLKISEGALYRVNRREKTTVPGQKFIVNENVVFVPAKESSE